MKGLYDRGMVMAYVVNAISRKKIEDTPAVAGIEFGSDAAIVAGVHL